MTATPSPAGDPDGTPAATPDPGGRPAPGARPGPGPGPGSDLGPGQGPDLGPAARQVASLAANVTEDQFDLPTPCERYAVRNLLGHLLLLAGAFRDGARKEPGPDPDPDAPLPDIGEGDGWRRDLPAALDDLAAAWRDPAAWQGETRVGGVTLPAAVLGRFGLNELVVHGWDLAVATGQRYEPDTASLEECRALLAMSAQDRPEGGPFGPALPFPADAPLLPQVIALSGRPPTWRP
jgi:uncharacterized protein (TIGR03086 family)